MQGFCVLQASFLIRQKRRSQKSLPLTPVPFITKPSMPIPSAHAWGILNAQGMGREGVNGGSASKRQQGERDSPSWHFLCCLQSPVPLCLSLSLWISLLHICPNAQQSHAPSRKETLRKERDFCSDFAESNGNH